ncbi:glycoside hydrolase family 3 N-terminal domain-containing protein [Ravibacter arvi]|uniref:beta-N-acetylhexosaminidase n=1 Tax=Ravibacter arvi TaxID=2051041 RepID=A0ABP8LW23_9BACT
MRHILGFVLLFLLAVPHVQAQQPSFLKADPHWVDSVFATLSDDEKIAQLLMVAVTSDVGRSLVGTDRVSPETVEKLVRDHKVGGVVFFQGGPVPQARVTNRLQSAAKVPLLVAMDAEFGLAMRIDSTVRYPYMLTLGAASQANDLIYRMGKEVAQQARRLGVHINFAPVADVNNNPANPVINFRSFGENKYQVAEKAVAYMRGMQDYGLLTSAKHFPGHGDTGSDSHHELPVISHNRQQLDSVELYPFKELIKNGLSGVMIAHLSIPALDDTPNLPSTLSKRIVTDLLRRELGFEGLVYSDAMNMKGITKYFSDGLADAKGLVAGMDVLEFTEDVPKAIARIKEAIEKGEITPAEIAERCKRVLAAKAWVGLNHYRPVALENLYEDLNPKAAELTNRLLTERALTVLKNDADLLPLRGLDSLKIAVVSIGDGKPTIFQKTAGLYTAVDLFQVSDKAGDPEIDSLEAALRPYDVVLLTLHLSSIRPGVQYGVTAAVNKALERITKAKKTVVTVLGNPYSLAKLTGIDRARAIVLGYQLTPYTEDLSAQLIFGAIPAVGKLPVTVNERFRYGNGIGLEAIGRLKYTVPEEIGIDSDRLNSRIDSMIALALREKATPGGVIQLAKDGKVFYRKAFGSPTYEEKRQVRETDLYDLASVTKITASTTALMGLYDSGMLDLDKGLGDYYRFFRKSNKADMKLRDLLTHKAGLKAFIVFWQNARKEDGTWKKKTFRSEASRAYPIEIVPGKLYLHRKYPARMVKGIKDSPLNATKDYVYSDLSFTLYPKIVKELSGESFEDYLQGNFFRKLGATSLTFNPLRYYRADMIAPTEVDTIFRHTLVHGHVHDETAAMMGGVSGHAGLFGNANDVMKVWQMYLQKGYYGGDRFLKPGTLETFTSYQFPEIGNRRGIGFDKPTFRYTGNAPRYASPSSYGHTGFTGIMTWADPAWGLNYVFLSNRVYPTRASSALGRLNIRTGIMDLVYEELMRKKAGND